MTVDHPQIAATVLAYYRGEASSEDVQSYFHPDVVVTDMVTPDLVVRGAEQYDEYFNVASADAFADMTIDIRTVVSDGDHLFIESSFAATWVGDYYGLEAHGGRVEWDLLDLWEFREGTITRIAFGADTLAAHRQLTAHSAG